MFSLILLTLPCQVFLVGGLLFVMWSFYLLLHEDIYARQAATISQFVLKFSDSMSGKGANKGHKGHLLHSTVKSWRTATSMTYGGNL